MNKKSTNIQDFIWQELVGKIPVREYKFHPTRKFRIDFSFTEKKLAIEIEGGAWQNGRHNRGTGFISDMEKYNLLTVMGWKLLRYQPRKIMFDQIKAVYNAQ